MFVLAAVLCVDHYVFVFDCLLFFLFLRRLFLLGLLDLFLDSDDVLFLEIRMVLCHFSGCQVIQCLDAQVGVFAIFAQLEGETAG